MTEDVLGDEEVDWSEYESGPFCRHWSDPADCDQLCVCGHKCCQHRGDECQECDCEQFKEPA